MRTQGTWKRSGLKPMWNTPGDPDWTPIVGDWLMHKIKTKTAKVCIITDFDRALPGLFAFNMVDEDGKDYLINFGQKNLENVQLGQDSTLAVMHMNGAGFFPSDTGLSEMKRMGASLYHLEKAEMAWAAMWDMRSDAVIKELFGA